MASLATLASSDATRTSLMQESSAPRLCRGLESGGAAPTENACAVLAAPTDDDVAGHGRDRGRVWPTPGCSRTSP